MIKYIFKKYNLEKNTYFILIDLSYFYYVNMLRSNCDNYKIQFDFQKNVRLKDNINAEVFIPKNERSYVFLNELEPIYIDKNKDTLLNILIKKSKK